MVKTTPSKVTAAKRIVREFIGDWEKMVGGEVLFDVESITPTANHRCEVMVRGRCGTKEAEFVLGVEMEEDGKELTLKWIRGRMVGGWVCVVERRGMGFRIRGGGKRRKGMEIPPHERWGKALTTATQLLLSTTFPHLQRRLTKLNWGDFVGWVSGVVSCCKPKIRKLKVSTGGREVGYELIDVRMIFPVRVVAEENGESATIEMDVVLVWSQGGRRRGGEGKEFPPSDLPPTFPVCVTVGLRYNLLQEIVAEVETTLKQPLPPALLEFQHEIRSVFSESAAAAIQQPTSTEPPLSPLPSTYNPNHPHQG